MKKLLFTFLSGLFAVFTAHAQLVESVYFDTRGSVAANGNQFSLKAEYLNLHVRGNLAPNLSYQLRQRFTKPFFKEGSPLNATDILSLTWDISPRWSVSAGKLPIFQGGYEWDAAPIDVYFWNGFAEFIPEIYALGGSLFFNPAPGQQLLLQATQSLMHLGHPDVFQTTLGWIGRFAPWWKTLWSISWADDPQRHNMGYISLGNRFEAGPVALELDLMYRRSLVQKNAGFDGSFAARLEYAPSPKWTLFAKAAGDRNDAVNVDPDGAAYDLTIAPGTSYLVAGGGVEFFPLGNKDLRLHAVAWAGDKPREFRALLGITYKLYLIRK